MECDRPVFRNEEKSKELWLGPDGQWCFSDAAGVDEEGDYDAFLESAEGENASSPEVADWADQHVHIHPVDIQAIEALHKSMEGDDSGYKDPEFVPGPAILDAAHGDSQWIEPPNYQDRTTSPALGQRRPSDIMQGRSATAGYYALYRRSQEFLPWRTRSSRPKRSPPTASMSCGCTREGRKMVHVTVDDRVPCGKA